MSVELTGRDKIAAAFTPEGTPECAAVICYEGIYIRDHWEQLTACPWWYVQDPNLERQRLWRREVFAGIGQDWFVLPACRPRAQRERLAVIERPDGAFLRDLATGHGERLARPRLAGWTAVAQPESVHPAHLATSLDEIDALIPAPPPFDPAAFVAEGRAALAAQLLDEYGSSLYPFVHVGAPLWLCYHIWGFEGLMTMIATQRDRVAYACQRYLAQSLHAVQQARTLGAAGVWIEDCLTDMVSPAAFAALNVAFLRPLVEEIRAAGMHSIYYFCGNPAGKWEHLLAIGADALSLEESKKGFVIHIEDVVARVQGRCVVLGNLDAIHLLPHASEAELRAEIERQLAAGRRNGRRFIMSLGSPVTPGTFVERVRLYCDLVHAMGRF